jgi:hypothetical protein
MPRYLSHALPLACLLAVACAPLDGSEASSTAVSEAPLVGIDGSRDSSDTGCNVVLRSMSRTPDATGGYVTKNNYSWVWTGQLDVSTAAMAENAVPAVLYQTASDPTWRAALAVKVSDGAGFSRFTVELWDGLPSAGMSGTSLANTSFKVIPYLKLAQGGRAFDHNRVHDPLSTYVLSGQSGLVVPPDASVCPAPLPQPAPTDAVTLAFAKNGNVTPSGPITPKSKVTINYDLDRLPSCRGTHNGYPAWDTVATVRFLPGGATLTRSVRELISNQGYPTNQARSLPLAFDIPPGTDSLEIWFENFSGIDSNCQAWDSNQSHNFVFPIQQPVGWIGDAVVLMSRSASGRCDGALPLNQGFDYGTWTRQRAALRNVCFQVWRAGTTDRDNPNLWREIGVQAHYRFAPTDPFTAAWVGIDGRAGNNARYAWDLSSVDPFAPYRCLTAPTTKSADGLYDIARMEFFFTANGVPLTQPGGAPFVGTFEDDAATPHPCTP